MSIIKKKLMSFTFGKTPPTGLICKLVPVCFLKHEYGLFERLSRNKFATEVERIKNIENNKLTI